MSALRAVDAKTRCSISAAARESYYKALLEDGIPPIVEMDVTVAELWRRRTASFPPGSDARPRRREAHRADPRIADVSGTRDWKGFDAAAVGRGRRTPRSPAARRVRACPLRECARPRAVIITTPNAEYNVKFETFPDGKVSPQGPPLRVDRGGVPAWAQGSRSASAIPSIPAVGPEDATSALLLRWRVSRGMTR